MKRFSIMCLALVMGLAFSVSAVYAEMSKEGSGEYRGGKSGTFEILKLGEDRLQMNWDETGVVVDAPENSPFVDASYRAMGSLHSIKGKWKGSGSIVFVCPNGDQILGVIESEGVLGVGNTGGGVDIIGGTGECSGIQGRMDFTSRPAVKSSKKGTYQGVGIGKVSWKLP